MNKPLWWMNEWHYRQMYSEQGRQTYAAIQYNIIQTCLFYLPWRTRSNGINWPSVAMGTVIMASFSLPVGNIEHSTRLVAGSLLLKAKFIDDHMTARSICLHIHFKSIKKGGMNDFPRVGYLIDQIESFGRTFTFSHIYFRISLHMPIFLKISF